MHTLHLMRCFFGPHFFVYVLRHASQLIKTPHFWRLCTVRHSYDPKLELGRDFCTMHLPPSFIILCLLVQKLSCWQTHKQTHKHTRKPTDYAENINVLRYSMKFGSKYVFNDILRPNERQWNADALHKGNNTSKVPWTYRQADDQSLHRAQRTRVLCETARDSHSLDHDTPSRFSPPTLPCSAKTSANRNVVFNKTWLVNVNCLLCS